MAFGPFGKQLSDAKKNFLGVLAVWL